MSRASIQGDEFIRKARSTVLENIGDEGFGVSELSAAMFMSRSSLLRNVKKHTGLSASQFIRQVRLEKSMDLLRETSMNISEISYEVGFGSTSYFIKCFREHYGYPPGEADKMVSETTEQKGEAVVKRTSGQPPWKIIIPVALALLIVGIVYWNLGSDRDGSELEKSIAVLPFRNESSDTTNVYFVNGLMEATLSNLQKIEDLRVISRTSVESYRNTDKAIPEIYEELNVSYFVEGSGQRAGDQVLLNIKLIEAASDRPIWSEQYSREVGDIFELQNEVAQEIAASIQAVVTPDELEQIRKKPTENLQAYDSYLRGLEYMNEGNQDGWIFHLRTP